MGQFSSYINATPSDPLTQAINVFTTLKSSDRADEDLKLRQADSARAEARWGQEQQEGALRLRTGEAEAAEKERVRKEAEKNRLIREYGDAKRAGREPSPEAKKAVAIFGIGTVNPTASRGEANAVVENFKRVIRSAEEVRQGVARGHITGPTEFVRDPSNPKKEETFKAFETLQRPRGDAVTTYQTYDTITGGTVPAQGKVSSLKRMYYDPKTDKWAFGFEVLDAETGRHPLLDPKTRKPIIAPATAGMTGNPDDQVVEPTTDGILETASVGGQLAQQHISNFGAESPYQQRIAIAKVYALTGDPKALEELRTYDVLGNYLKGLRSQAAEESDPTKKEFLLRKIAWINDYGATATEAEQHTMSALGEKETKRLHKIGLDQADEDVTRALEIQKKKDEYARKSKELDEPGETRRLTTKSAIEYGKEARLATLQSGLRTGEELTRQGFEAGENDKKDATTRRGQDMALAAAERGDHARAAAAKDDNIKTVSTLYRTAAATAASIESKRLQEYNDIVAREKKANHEMGTPPEQSELWRTNPRTGKPYLMSAEDYKYQSSEYKNALRMMDSLQGELAGLGVKPPPVLLGPSAPTSAGPAPASGGAIRATRNQSGGATLSLTPSSRKPLSAFGQ